jgi:hypothetical protein
MISVLADRPRFLAAAFSLLGTLCVLLPWLHLPVLGLVLGFQGDRATVQTGAFAGAFILTVGYPQNRLTVLVTGMLGLAGMGLARWYVYAATKAMAGMRAEGDRPRALSASARTSPRCVARAWPRSRSGGCTGST